MRSPYLLGKSSILFVAYNTNRGCSQRNTDKTVKNNDIKQYIVVLRQNYVF